MLYTNSSFNVNVSMNLDQVAPLYILSDSSIQFKSYSLSVIDL